MSAANFTLFDGNTTQTAKTGDPDVRCALPVLVASALVGRKGVAVGVVVAGWACMW